MAGDGNDGMASPGWLQWPVLMGYQWTKKIKRGCGLGENIYRLTSTWGPMSPEQGGAEFQSGGLQLRNGQWLIMELRKTVWKLWQMALETASDPRSLGWTDWSEVKLSTLCVMSSETIRRCDVWLYDCPTCACQHVGVRDVMCSAGTG